MHSTSPSVPLPEACSGFSVVFAERVLRQAQLLGLNDGWAQLQLGHPSRRVTAYRPPQRIAALLASLAAGLKGIAPANHVLRPNAALVARLGGRFPDQGTIHRWLDAATDAQATAFRTHLHQVVAAHGHFWNVLYSPEMLIVDIDGQGLRARGPSFQKAAVGYLGDGLDKGYQRFVCYAAQTSEVLDEMLTPGNCTLMSQLPPLLDGLDAVIRKRYRKRVLLRMDSHGGTIDNLRCVRQHGYHYLCPPHNWATLQRLRQQVQGRRGGWFTATDSTGAVRHVQFWIIPRYKLSGKGRGRKAYTRVTVYREQHANGKREWSALLTDLKREKGKRAWSCYHGRSGAIEEYNDQSERAYHLEVLRTRHFEGLQVVQALVGLCWNLTRWALASLELPPLSAPSAERGRWLAALTLDLAGLLARAAHSGVRLYRAQVGAVLEVEDTAGTPESAAWLRWLEDPVQLRLPLTG